MMELSQKLERLIETAVEKEEIAGANIVVIRDGQEMAFAADGYADIEAGKKYERDTIARLYSMTKPVTSAAAMLLIVFYHMNCEWSARLMESPLVVTKIGTQGYLGWQGVSLFILVSGAAQCISYERCSDLKTYYKKRWWSIFPSFYMA